MPGIFTPLIPITVASIYQDSPLPERMAKCTPDTAAAIQAIVRDVRSLGHELLLSDLFRGYDMQKAAHLDYVEKRKQAFSPAPGGSMHEAGRAMDIDLTTLRLALSRFWEIARAHGFSPIIEMPNPNEKESWHFDCRGSHGLVYDYVKSGKGGSDPAYTQMARSGIGAIGVRVDALADQNVGYIQAGLIRLGADPGGIDGVMGDRTRGAMAELGIAGDDATSSLGALLQAQFPAEYAQQSS